MKLAGGGRHADTATGSRHRRPRRRSAIRPARPPHRGADKEDRSTPPPAGAVSKPLTFNDIDQIAKSENMIPGYSIVPPSDATEDGETTYGSYTVVNHWPQKLSEQRTLYLDQFTGQTIANATADQDGALDRITSWGQHPHGHPVRRLHPDPRHPSSAWAC